MKALPRIKFTRASLSLAFAWTAKNRWPVVLRRPKVMQTSIVLETSSKNHRSERSLAGHFAHCIGFAPHHFPPGRIKSGVARGHARGVLKKLWDSASPKQYISIQSWIISPYFTHATARFRFEQVPSTKIQSAQKEHFGNCH